MKVLDYYGKSIILAILIVLLFAGATVAKISTVEMLTMFWGGERIPITVTFGGDADVTFGGETVTFGVE